MKVFVDGPVMSRYGMAFLVADAVLPYNQELAFAGQENGLLGVGIPNAVMMRFGLHTGDVHFRLAVAAYAPPVDPEWEEVVEVSWSFSGQIGVVFEEFMPTEPGRRIPLGSGTYRLRFSAKNYGVQENWVADGKPPEELPEIGGSMEYYELLVWPAPWAPDGVVKATQPSAKGWHSHQKAMNLQAKEQRGEGR
jgi:hypothetical protein